MNYLSQFNIPFVGLKKGVSNFEYNLDSRFFAEFPESLVKQGNVTVNLSFEKRNSLFILTFVVGGTVFAECDRCLEGFNQPIEGEHTVYVKLKDEAIVDSKDADVMYITYDDTHLDISRLLYDYVSLSIPARKVHPEAEGEQNGCDREVLELLNRKEEDKKSDTIDPRWAELEKLKSKIV